MGVSKGNRERYVVRDQDGADSQSNRSDESDGSVALNCGALGDAPGRVKGGDEFDGLGKIGRFCEERVCAEFVSFFNDTRGAVATEDDDGQAMQWARLANVLEDFKATFARHNDIEDD